MRRSFLGLTMGIMAVLGLAAQPAWAQSGTTKSAITGTVVDSAGGVVPGATVVVKNANTGVETRAVTNAAGVFDVPALDTGKYAVTVTLQGFRTVVLSDVELLASSTRSLKVTLEVGSLTETVEVVGGSHLIQTQSTTIASTIRVDQISNLPLITRNALNFVVFLPGVDTAANNHSQRQSTISGLPQSVISITVDGANIQDKYTRSGDGFFANIHPKLDLIEEVTVSAATASADSAGQGAVQVKFVTRSGTNKFAGSAYSYMRNRDLNTNYYFNELNGLPKNVLTLNQYGFRLGGPIVVPSVYDGRGKAFFFFNFEQLRFPLSNTRTRGLLTARAQEGFFRYGPNGSREINLYAVAAANGQTATPDQTIAALLTKIRSGTTRTGIVNPRTDPNAEDYLWQPESLRIDNSPGGRVDFNLGANHRLTATGAYQGQRLDPNLFGGDEPNFPGLANSADLYSAVSRGAVSLRSTVTTNFINELRFGFSNAPVWFADRVDATQFDDQGGFNIGFPGIGSQLTSATTNAGPTSRNGKSLNLENTVHWSRNNHTVQFGGAFSRISGWTRAQTSVPSIGLGVDTNDPANAMFTTANFPDAVTADLNNARALYALLTGRVTSVGSEVRLDGATGKYVYMGVSDTEEHQDEIGFYVQDSWRMRRNLTINAGLRWQVSLPFTAATSVYSMNSIEDACGISGPGDGPGGRQCNFFNPGVFNPGGRAPIYELFEAGAVGYKTDYDNFAPNLGVAWQPEVQNGWLRQIMGDPATSTIRASYGVSYNSEGLAFYRDIYNALPGNTVNTSRTATSTQFPLVGPGESWPVLFRNPERLGPSPNNPVAPSYPTPANFNSGVSLFHPTFKTPFARSFSVGFQRNLGTRMAVEVRYVGTRLVDGSVTENWNQRDYVANGFLDEFKLAQQNLQVAIGQGCGQTGRPACSFAYQGPNTGTYPLPIYLANFNGVSPGLSGDAARYTGANWTNTTRLGELALRSPNPAGTVNELFTNATFRTNFAAAGYPRNFFVLNPDVNSVTVRTNGNRTKYDAMQINLRRQLSGGLALDANYTYAKRYDSRLDDLRLPREYVLSTDGVPHALKTTVYYDLPFGRGRTYGADMNPWIDGAVGGWSLNLTARVQSGSILNFGNVRVVGMSQDQLRDAFRIRIDEANKIVYSLEQDIIDNTIKAFSASATSATGYGPLGPPSGRYLAPANGPDCIQEVRGQCAPSDVFVEGPIFTRFDLNVKKRFAVGGSRSVDVGVDIMNLFDAINFLSVAQAGSGATINQVSTAYQDPNVTFDPGGRLMQIHVRFSF